MRMLLIYCHSKRYLCVHTFGEESPPKSRSVAAFLEKMPKKQRIIIFWYRQLIGKEIATHLDDTGKVFALR